MKRETTEELQARMQAARNLVPAGLLMRHRRTGTQYVVRGHSLRAGDLRALVQYAASYGPVIVFSREIDEVRAKFELSDGERWPDALGPTP